MTRSIGMIFLCVFLLLTGLLLVTNIKFELQNFALGTSAIAAAIFLALGK